MSAPMVKGWCPGAHRPMMSGDGLLVRVRPHDGRVDAQTAHGLADLAERFGNGILDLTSRANLQIRGVREDHHAPLLSELC
ncbi:MAG: cobalamin biosynthesis protein CobG, partial [Pseudomonadota bacterium]